MERRRVRRIAGAKIRAPAAAAATIAFMAAIVTGALAQTLTEPHSPTRHSRPVATTSQGARHAKPCTAFGAGFVNVPGSDACIKVGGWVTFEGASR